MRDRELGWRESRRVRKKACGREDKSAFWQQKQQNEIARCEKLQQSRSRGSALQAELLLSILSDQSNIGLEKKFVSNLN